MSSLRLIKEATPSSGDHYLDLTDVFTSDFDIYKVTSSNLFGDSATASALNLRFIDSGGNVLATNYDYCQIGMKGENTFTENRDTAPTRLWNVFGGIDDNAEAQGSRCYIYHPVSSTNHTYCMWHSANHPSGNLRSYKGVGVLHQNISVTGFRVEINESAADFDAGGYVRVYGLRIE